MSGCGRLVIAGTGSGVGKTSLALGLARLLARQGLRVQTFKVGPDFLDPTYLARASGRTCYNLDGWMTSRDYVQQLFARATADADLALIEGVMGLFDGASPDGLTGSTAEIAAWLDAPVVLVAGVHGVARSLAAVVRGFAGFEPSVRVAGVIANQGGSPRHRRWLGESLSAAACPPLVGMIPRESLPTLPSRHLGLVAADQGGFSLELCDALADVCAEHLDQNTLRKIAASAGDSCATAAIEAMPSSCAGDSCATASVEAVPSAASHCLQASSGTRIRIGIARDEAFHFYYPDNLDALAACGAAWIPFSPLADTALPAGLDAVYFGGGYPEAHAARLAENRAMLASIRDFAAAGGAVYGECGGLMYLGRSLESLAGTRYPLAGVLPIDTVMLPKLQTLGYAEVSWTGDCLWGPAGATVRGHEFHYSRLADAASAEGWQPAYRSMRRGAKPALEGLRRGRVQAGYVHLHWASRPETAKHFVSACEKT